MLLGVLFFLYLNLNLKVKVKVKVGTRVVLVIGYRFLVAGSRGPRARGVFRAGAEQAKVTSPNMAGGPRGRGVLRAPAAEERAPLPNMSLIHI